MNAQPPPTAQPIFSNPTQLRIPEAVSEGAQNVTDSLNTAKTNITDTLGSFSNKADAGVTASNEFLMSNTIVAKFAFLILVIIVFMFLINLGIYLIGYFTTPSSTPYLVQGMINGNASVIIPQDPKQSNSVTILRSNNQSTGAEFTWSVWLFISDLQPSAVQYHHIFSKGDTTFDKTTNLYTLNNSPGLYLSPNINTLHLVMSTVSPTDDNDVIDISNVPLRKWFHVAIRLENTILDVYVNGTISSRIILQNVPKQNYNDVLVCQNGGFMGNLSDLRYYNYALNVFQISAIVSTGPTTTAATPSTGSITTNYLSSLWYSSKL